jgi:hypothetical protein
MNQSQIIVLTVLVVWVIFAIILALLSAAYYKAKGLDPEHMDKHGNSLGMYYLYSATWPIVLIVTIWGMIWKGLVTLIAKLL